MMTPEQFKQARQALDLSQAQLAIFLGMGEHGGRAVRRWESGERSPNPIAVTALRWIIDGTRPRDLLAPP